MVTEMILPDEDLGLFDPHSARLQPLLIPVQLDASELKKYRVLFICFTNRCGSNYLAELLARSGLYNVAGEFLNFDTVLNHQKIKGFNSLAEYFSILMQERSVANNFACKISATQLAMLYRIGLLQQLAPSSKFLMIERGDLLKQAISLDIASRTGQWTSYMEARNAVDESSFEAAKLRRMIKSLARQQYYFRLFFGVNGINPFQVNYETLISDGAHVLNRLMSWLGHDRVSIRMDNTDTSKQSGQLNDLWRKKYFEQFTASL